ncbi:hypothetical protein [Enterococcus sp. BWR-S5]|uniref:hypothetical protein n=1 Tax=Enterococcus sp. BWR-S5 TaxID=2787714 RepID=UPI001923C71D|nr:hypothetical protein [Enterococcus sp. BWR-S5]MBL1225749.1 hypothetical protein [Enterococcus sp. BWR-S5]
MMKRALGKWVIVSVGVVSLGGAILLYTTNQPADAGQETTAGAKLNKVADKPFALPKETQVSSVEEAQSEEAVVDETVAVRLIDIEHGAQVTKKDLMKYKWMAVDTYLEELGEDLSSVEFSTIHTFTETERKLETVNTRTGESLEPTAKPATSSVYTFDGNIFHEEFHLTNQTLQATYQLSWQGNRILFNPYDEYDHKEERQTVFQPVEIVK